ncbi:MAG: GNAT family N-acetyltransferase [Actinomycetota bacterium]
MRKVSLTIPGDSISLPLVPALAQRFAATHGIEAFDGDRLTSLVSVLSSYALDRAYGDQSDGDIEVTLILEGREVSLQIRDWGEPTTSFGPGIGDPPDVLLAAAPHASDLRLETFGGDGVRLTASLELRSEPAIDHRAPMVRREAERPDIKPEEIEIRDATVADVEPISRLIYSTYGLSYVHPDFYRPRWLATQIQDGHMVSTVALYAGDVVGHHALFLKPDTPSAESGAAAVNPIYRGLGIFGKLFAHTKTRASAHGLSAIFGCAVTVHPYSQRVEHRQGYRETALLLGHTATWETFREISVANQNMRNALLVSYLILEAAPRPVTLPSRYRDELIAAYSNIGLEISDLRATALDGDAVNAGESVVYTTDDAAAVGSLRIDRWDNDTPQLLQRALRHLVMHHEDVIYADINISAIADATDAIEALNASDFFYSGLIPFGLGGHDYLRLQRIDAENVETEHLVLDSPFSQALLATTLADRARVEPVS